MLKTRILNSMTGLMVLMLLSCSSEIITVHRAPPPKRKAAPTYETSKVRPQVFTQTINAPADKAAHMLYYTLLLMDIGAEKIDNTSPVAFKLARTPLLPIGGEVGEFFSGEKRAEDALAWTFNKESLESGREGNLALYMKKGGLITGMMKSGSSGPVNAAYFEGNITVKPAGRTRSTMTGEILYFASVYNSISGGYNKKVYKSTGRLEKIIAKQVNDMLAFQPRVFPGGVDQVKKVALSWMASHGLAVDYTLDNGLITKRVTPPRKGDDAVGNFAKLARQLMPVWIGSYRALFTFAPGDEQNTTKVRTHFIFFAINGNNGKRRWEIYPSKGVLEEDFFTYMRETTKKYR